MPIFNMSVTYLQSIKKDILNAVEGIDSKLYALNMCGGRKIAKLTILQIQKQ